MSDNVRLTDHDKVLAADEIGNVKHLKVKMQFGGENVATDVSNTDPLPVDIGDTPIAVTIDQAVPISFSDSATIDAFGRMRVSIQHMYLKIRINMMLSHLFTTL